LKRICAIGSNQKLITLIGQEGRGKLLALELDQVRAPRGKMV